jgi:hypothetical protein
MGHKSGWRWLGGLKRRRSSADTNTEAIGSTGATLSSKLANTGEATVDTGATEAQALSSARAMVTNANLIMTGPK